MRIAAIALCILVCAAAAAEGMLTARIEGNTLSVAWNAACAGDCTLTVYRDGWPVRVCTVSGEGAVQMALDGAPGRWSARLRMPNGCLTAEASGGAVRQPETDPTVKEPAPEPVPTTAPQPTEKPLPQPTEAPAPKPTAAPAVDGTNRPDLAAEVIRQVNAERAKQGLSPLREDAELTRAACVRAKEIAQKFSHTRPDGSAWRTVSGAAYGENIARGQRTADKVMAAWLTSQGHRENILRASYGSIGVCAFVRDGVVHWVQLFGK